MKHKSKFISFLISLYLISNLAYSQADNTASTGNWGDGGTWSAGVPVDGTLGSETVLLIPAGVTVTIPAFNYITLNNVILVIEGSLSVANGSFLGFSALTINGTGSGIVLSTGGAINDGSSVGLFPAITVDGAVFWGGANYVGDTPQLPLGDHTATSEETQPPGFSNPLPVQLIEFNLTTNEEYVLLEWVTASELNNEGFVIQKSIDGENFEEIGFVDGHGTTTDVHTYSFTDYGILDAYYRLKQIDFDGKFEYSPIRYAIHEKILTEKFEVYPNPTSGIINIKGAMTNYALFDETGKLLLDNPNTTAPIAQSEISEYLVGQVESGTFFIKTVLNGKQKVLRVIKK